jgi:hypothetical protein
MLSNKNTEKYIVLEITSRINEPIPLPIVDKTEN